MDLQYDHIAEEALRDNAQPSASSSPDDKKPEQQQQQQPQQPQHTLNEDLQEAYKAISTSAWGSRLGGFFGNVVKQVEPVYREASQELTSLGVDAARGASDLRTSLIARTRSLSLVTGQPAEAESSTANKDAKDKEADATPTGTRDMSSEQAIKENESLIARLKAEGAKRLKDIQQAEDAADEALLKFGANLRDFLKEAVSITPAPADGQGSNTVLFESKDASGKRVIHTSRYDAQLHVIHTTADSFTKDPTSTEFAPWGQGFDAEKKTEDISSDLAKYPELRATMEKLVPDQVPYADFWKRYYFLRHSIETAEARRRDLLKAASAEEEVGWDEDSEEEGSEEEESSEEEDSDDETTAPSKSTATDKPVRPASTESSTTIHPPAAKVANKDLLKPSEPRKSNDEKSQADSDTSYDVVGATSGNPSQAPNSPKEPRKGDDSDDSDDDDDSDEEDWE
ncbi:BSD domain protein [Apiospora hydei]|uniref:BSD domain protein n=1 Tax=Apiospora hydei TaxID=1337664 RepID=A0ABR1WRS6_9PEZI